MTSLGPALGHRLTSLLELPRRRRRFATLTMTDAVGDLEVDDVVLDRADRSRTTPPAVTTRSPTASEREQLRAARFCRCFCGRIMRK